VSCRQPTPAPSPAFVLGTASPYAGDLSADKDAPIPRQSGAYRNRTGV